MASKKTGKKRTGKKVVQKRSTGARHAGKDRDAAVARLRNEDPTTVARETGFTVDSLRRWGRAEGIQLIDGRTGLARAPTEPMKKHRKSHGAAPAPAPIEDSVATLVKGLTSFMDSYHEARDARLDERIEAKVREVISKIRS